MRKLAFGINRPKDRWVDPLGSSLPSVKSTLAWLKHGFLKEDDVRDFGSYLVKVYTN